MTISAKRIFRGFNHAIAGIRICLLVSAIEFTEEVIEAISLQQGEGIKRNKGFFV